ncbi:hypothetical protein MAPG_04636, partial [Magnaporthiopsis poae ATCC 64411]
GGDRAKQEDDGQPERVREALRVAGAERRRTREAEQLAGYEARDRRVKADLEALMNEKLWEDLRDRENARSNNWDLLHEPSWESEEFRRPRFRVSIPMHAIKKKTPVEKDTGPIRQGGRRGQSAAAAVEESPRKRQRLWGTGSGTEAKGKHTPSSDLDSTRALETLEATTKEAAAAGAAADEASSGVGNGDSPSVGENDSSHLTSKVNQPQAKPGAAVKSRPKHTRAGAAKLDSNSTFLM